MWFDVDKKGLSQLVTDRRSKSWLVYELVSNAWDEPACTVVMVRLYPYDRGYAQLVVEDNSPDGFADLRHAYTLFASSRKKGEAEQRGRFNLGEKLVLALCREAEIATTTGTVSFRQDGTRHQSRTRTESGSVFRGVIRMTKDEIEAVVDEVSALLLPPNRVVTMVNGATIQPRVAVGEFEAALPTVLSDEDGNLRRSVRKTRIAAFDPTPGRSPMLYELGIPVCELEEDRWSLDVRQKVPLAFDRQSVTEGYLRRLRVATLNALYEKIDPQDATAAWVRDAVSDEAVDNVAVTRAMDLRYGAKRVVFDPRDQEANKIAMSQGYTVIAGGALSKGEWASVKRAGAALPAGQVTPSPKITGGNCPVLAPEDYSTDQTTVVEYSRELARALINAEISVVLVFGNGNWDAGWRDQRLQFNLNALDADWWRVAAGPSPDALHQLLIHEFGHHWSDDHFSSEYHEALCRLGVWFAMLAKRSPETIR